MRLPLLFALAAAAPLALVPAAPVLAQSPPRPAWDGRLMPPEKVADHVWVMRQPDRLWAAVIGNVTIVEQSDGVVLIDSGGTVNDGEDILAEVAKLTPKPVKAVAITHWHNDHPFGLPAIVAKYPKVRIIGTAATGGLMLTETNTGLGKVDEALNKARHDRGIKTLDDFAVEAAKPDVSADMRAQYEIERKWIAMRIERQLRNYIVPPTEMIVDKVTLDDAVAPIEVKFLGTGNTHGDLVAWLPKQRVVAAGDIVVAPTPYGFSVSTRPWLATIAAMEALPFTTLIPGHGKVQRDRAYLDTLKWSMGDIAAKAASAAANAATTQDEAWAAFDRKPHEARFAATDAWTRKWLSDYWLEGMFRTAFDEARGVAAPGK